jgi:hypothetical protein
MNSITQLSKEEAARCFDCGHYLNWSDVVKAEFQLRQEHLCMSFNVYQQALEASLGRSIATNELMTVTDYLPNLKWTPEHLAHPSTVSTQPATRLNKSTNNPTKTNDLHSRTNF